MWGQITLFNDWLVRQRAFMGIWSTTRVIIDYTEYQVKKFKTPTAQIQTWGEYNRRLGFVNSKSLFFQKENCYQVSRLQKQNKLPPQEFILNVLLRGWNFFFFLQKVTPLKVKHTIDNVSLICAAIRNLYPKLVQ